jgi:flagellar basal body-associated protein FliL
MAVLIRILLIGLVVYLAMRIIASFGARTATSSKEGQKSGKNKKKNRNGIPDEIGEYVDYEDVEDKN